MQYDRGGLKLLKLRPVETKTGTSNQEHQRGLPVVGWPFFFSLCALPPFLVKNASLGSRTTWAVFLGMLAFAALISASANLAPKYQAKLRRVPERYYRRFILSTLTAFSLAVLGSITIVNFAGSSTWMATALENISNYIEVAFPFVRKYGQYAGPHLQVVKLRGVASLWLLFSVFTVCAVAARYHFMSPAERKGDRELREQGRGHGWTGGKAFFGGLFGLGLALFAYFGKGMLDPVSRFSQKACLLHVSCFIQNDLAIIASAGMFSLVIFGFGIGSVLMIRRAFSELKSDYV